MFKNLFKKKNKGNLFDKLFPLTQENKDKIELKVRDLQKQMFSEEGFDNLINTKREYDKNIIQFSNLKFDNFKWEKVDVDKSGDCYTNKFGDFLVINSIAPNGDMKRNSPSQIEVYRNWTRELFVKENGGIILCEDVKLSSGIELYESIGKICRESTGMDYLYFLNIRNYNEQLLYQIQIKVQEAGITGLRDNIFMHSIYDLFEIDMGELMKQYRQDPYDKNFQEGNTMNISEREEFDYLFPFHPLSIIRMDIKPRILKSLEFIK